LDTPVHPPQPSMGAIMRAGCRSTPSGSRFWRVPRRIEPAHTRESGQREHRGGASGRSRLSHPYRAMVNDVSSDAARENDGSFSSGPGARPMRIPCRSARNSPSVLGRSRRAPFWCTKTSFLSEALL
jgi:hypothetical protein